MRFECRQYTYHFCRCGISHYWNFQWYLLYNVFYFYRFINNSCRRFFWTAIFYTFLFGRFFLFTNCRFFLFCWISDFGFCIRFLILPCKYLMRWNHKEKCNKYIGKYFGHALFIDFQLYLKFFQPFVLSYIFDLPPPLRK